MRVLIAILVYSLAVPAWAERSEPEAREKATTQLFPANLAEILEGIETATDDEEEDAKEAKNDQDEISETDADDDDQDEQKLDEKQKAAVTDFTQELSKLFLTAMSGLSFASTADQLAKTLLAAQKMSKALANRRPDPKKEDDEIKKLIAGMSDEDRKALIKKLLAGKDDADLVGPDAKSDGRTRYAERDRILTPPQTPGIQFSPRPAAPPGISGGFGGGCTGGRCGGGVAAAPSRGQLDRGGHTYNYGSPGRSGMSGGFGSPGGRTFSGPRDSMPPSEGKFPDEDLVPAGTRGNPSFEFSGEGDRKATAQGISTEYQNCQGTPTLIDPEAKVCQFVTAAHCVITESGRVVSKYNTADFGEFYTKEVQIMDSDGTVGSDMAIVTFRGEACAEGAKKKIKVAKLATEPLKRGDVVFGAARYFGKLLYGTVASVRPGNAVEINYNYLSASGAGHQGGIHSGDSGGGLFSFDKEGNPVLHAVLSASTEESQKHFINGQPTVGGREGFYSTALDFAQAQVARAKKIASDERNRLATRTPPAAGPRT